jgi:response regulator RpfG family c-di-GMP phosphodiesterase
MKTVILIVDDEPNIAAALERLLRPDGYELRVAHDGPTALQVLAGEEIAALICDQRMPAMNGAQVLAAAARMSPDTYRIMITGYADLQSVQESVNEGHIGRLVLKPWNDAQLRAAVGEGVQLFQQTRENRQLLELTQRQKGELAAWNERLTSEVQERTAELQSQNRELQRLQQQARESLHDVVNVLSALIEQSEPSLALHCKRVAQLARLLGERIALEPRALQSVEFAARLHEIGRMGRRAAAAGPRTSPRTQQADHDRQQAETGSTILSRVRGFEDVARAVHSQYERFDGSGFPDALLGDAIPLFARIVAIADAYDTAAAAGGPLAPISDEAGRRVLRAGQGRAFDPLLVHQLIEALEDYGAGQLNRELELPPYQLAPGMVLAGDLRTAHGVLVLRGGTRLTPEHIWRIRAISASDPLLCGVHVQPPGDAAGNAAPAREVAGGATSPTAAALAGTCRVLIVDDDDLVRNALVRELRGFGCEVICARDGREAQNVLEEHNFDMLLIDVAMPVMSGAALVSHVQQCWPDQPCLILTGHATREQLERIRQAPNVVGVLSKPWDPQVLISTIRAGIQKHRAAAAQSAR